MKIRQNVAIALSGILWMGVGIFLLVKGFSLILTPEDGSKPSSLYSYMFYLSSNPQQAALLLICLGLFIGFLKGRFILSKTALRIVRRIQNLSNPCSVFSIYSISYLLLLSSMIILGISFKWLPIPFDVKGVIDVAIGSALTNGSSFYFRHLTAHKKGH